MYALRFVCFEVNVCFEVCMWTSLNRFSGYQSGLARRGFDKKLPTFLDVSVKLFTILIPKAPRKKNHPVFSSGTNIYQNVPDWTKLNICCQHIYFYFAVVQKNSKSCLSFSDLMNQ